MGDVRDEDGVGATPADATEDEFGLPDAEAGEVDRELYDAFRRAFEDDAAPGDAPATSPGA